MRQTIVAAAAAQEVANQAYYGASVFIQKYARRRLARRKVEEMKLMRDITGTVPEKMDGAGA
eukprot:1603832-Prymnesium_polylepis.1